MKFFVYFVFSLLASLSILIYSVYTHEQFYPIILFLVSSKISMVVNANLLFALGIAIGKLGNYIFLGQLRDVEIELLIERSKYTITETCLALTIFRNELSPSVIALFGALLFLKAFHWLSSSRLEYLDQVMPQSNWVHIRLALLIVILGTCDVLITYSCIQYTITNGKSVLFLFGFEFGLLCVSAVNLLFRFIFHVLDSHLPNGFTSKGFYVMILDLICDAFRFVTYVFFFCLVFVYYGLPIHIIRELWMAFYNFQRRLTSFIKYCKLSKNLDNRFVTATAEELVAAGDCLICREPMESGKKLPCSHVFHLDCLRMWLQHQQSCPLCRSDIPLSTPTPPSAAFVAAAAVAAELHAAEDHIPRIPRAGHVGGGGGLGGGGAVLRRENNVTTARQQRQELLAYHQHQARQRQQNAALGGPYTRDNFRYNRESKVTSGTFSLISNEVNANTAQADAAEQQLTVTEIENELHQVRSEQFAKSMAEIMREARVNMLKVSEQSDSSLAPKEETVAESALESKDHVDTEEVEANNEEPGIDWPEMPTVTEPSLQVSPTFVGQRRTPHPEISHFPCLYVVVVLGDKKGTKMTASVHSSPNVNSEIIRLLENGKVVMVKSRHSDNYNHRWLQLPDGWALEREDTLVSDTQRESDNNIAAATVEQSPSSAPTLLVSVVLMSLGKGSIGTQALKQKIKQENVALTDNIDTILPSVAQSDFESTKEEAPTTCQHEVGGTGNAVDLPFSGNLDSPTNASATQARQFVRLQDQLLNLQDQVAEMKRQSDRMEKLLLSLAKEKSDGADGSVTFVDNDEN